jgi:hypothetical protein
MIIEELVHHSGRGSKTSLLSAAMESPGSIANMTNIRAE